MLIDREGVTAVVASEDLTRLTIRLAQAGYDRGRLTVMSAYALAVPPAAR
jgi:hypothetical protein